MAESDNKTLFLDNLIANPQQIPELTPEGEDCEQISELIKEIIDFREQIAFLNSLKPHRARCGSEEIDKDGFVAGQPPWCDSCLENAQAR